MERDALIAHGTSFLLQDRLMNCSDYSTAWVCRSCGSLVSLGFDQVTGERHGEGGEYCRICANDEKAEKERYASTMKKEEGGKSKHGVVVRGERRGNMDVIAVPCKSCSTDCLPGRKLTRLQMCLGTCVPRWLVWVSG
jgi:DNA-directed RNA polymerase I subunit RPA2